MISSLKPIERYNSIKTELIISNKILRQIRRIVTESNQIITIQISLKDYSIR